jgi:hypothetical protein
MLFITIQTENLEINRNEYYIKKKKNYNKERKMLTKTNWIKRVEKGIIVMIYRYNYLSYFNLFESSTRHHIFFTNAFWHVHNVLPVYKSLFNPNISIGLYRCYFFFSHEVIITCVLSMYGCVYFYVVHTLNSFTKRSNTQLPEAEGLI